MKLVERCVIACAGCGKKLEGFEQVATLDAKNPQISICDHFSFESNTCNLFSFIQPRVQIIPLPCHRRLITSTLRHNSVLHRSLGGHRCSLRHRRNRDVELCDVELVIINL